MMKKLVLLAFFVIGCGSSQEKADPVWNNQNNQNDAGSDADAQGDVPDAGGDVPDADVPEPEDVPELAGTWANVQVNGSLLNVPMVGVKNNRIVSLVLVQMTQEGSTLTVRETVCDIKNETDTTLVTTIMPQAFIDSMPVEEKQTRLVWTGAAWAYEQPQHWALQGVHLDDIVNDPLPTDPADPRVFDQDLDGHPGLTVRVTGLINGDIYVIQRGWNAMLSREFALDRIYGHMTWGNEQVVLGATNSILEQPIESTVDPDPAKSWFEFVRVAPDFTCTDVIDQKDVLFPRLAQ